MAKKANKSILVANPTARSGAAKRSIKKAIKYLERRNLQPEFLPTLPAGATVEAVAQRLEQDDVARVIYMGGDGTFAEAAKGIILARERSGIDVPLGMLPMGTANDQGRSFGIPAGAKALENNVEIIAQGIERWLDVGSVTAFGANGEVVAQDLWFDTYGVGLSAQILASRNRDREVVERIPLLRQIYRDKLVYTGAALRSWLMGMLNNDTFDAIVTIDGRVHAYAGVTDLLVQGTILYAGDWIFAPDALPDDGQFEVIVVRGHADWMAATMRSHKGNPVTEDDREVLGLSRREIPKGSHIEILIKQPAGSRAIAAQIDGEEFVATSHYRVDNLFHHLRILVPENDHWI